MEVFAFLLWMEGIGNTVIIIAGADVRPGCFLAAVSDYLVYFSTILQGQYFVTPFRREENGGVMRSDNLLELRQALRDGAGTWTEFS